MNTGIKQILESLERGDITSEEALLKLKAAPFDDLGYAKVDTHRSILQGAAEVIYGAGKTPSQIIGIMKSMINNGQERIMVTRLSEEAASEVKAALDASGFTVLFPRPTASGRSSLRPAALVTFPWRKKPRSPRKATATKSSGCMTWESPDFIVFLPIKKRS